MGGWVGGAGGEMKNKAKPQLGLSRGFGWAWKLFIHFSGTGLQKNTIPADARIIKGPLNTYLMC